MLKPKEIKERVTQLIAEDKNLPYVAGKGILIDSQLAFDSEKIEQSKKEIATILQELGVDKLPLVRLSSLATLENGETWNSLQNMEEFEALDLFLACSSACGFIYNEPNIMQLNANELGKQNSSLISRPGRSLVGNDDEWLKLIREKVIKNMYFLTDLESIREFSTDNPKSATIPVQKYKKD